MASLNRRFEQLYSRMGRPSILPEVLLRATLLSGIKAQAGSAFAVAAYNLIRIPKLLETG